MFNITLEQQFDYRRMTDAAKQMSKEQACEMLTQAHGLLMRKTNIIKDMNNCLETGCVHNFNDNSFQLTLEQQLETQTIKLKAQRLSVDEVINNLLDTMLQLMMRDNLIKDLMKKM